MPKRKATQQGPDSDDDEEVVDAPPPSSTSTTKKKLTAAERRAKNEQARLRAAQAMEADRLKVEANKAKKAASQEMTSPTKRRKTTTSTSASAASRSTRKKTTATATEPENDTPMTSPSASTKTAVPSSSSTKKKKTQKEISAEIANQAKLAAQKVRRKKAEKGKRKSTTASASDASTTKQEEEPAEAAPAVAATAPSPMQAAQAVNHNQQNINSNNPYAAMNLPYFNPQGVSMMPFGAAAAVNSTVTSPQQAYHMLYPPGYTAPAAYAYHHAAAVAAAAANASPQANPNNLHAQAQAHAQAQIMAAALAAQQQRQQQQVQSPLVSSQRAASTPAASASKNNSKNKKKQSSTKATTTASSASSKRTTPKKNHNSTAVVPQSDDDDDEALLTTTAPTPTRLQQQISHQVLENAKATFKGEALPYPQASPEAQNYDPAQDEVDGGVVDEEPMVVDEMGDDAEADYTSSSNHSNNHKLYLVALVPLVVLYLLTGSWPVLPTTDTTSSDDLPCFLGGGYEGCSSTGVPCPDGGICLYGKLFDCEDAVHYSIAPDQRSCELNEATQATLDFLETKITSLTAQVKCKECCDSHPMPRFDYQQELVQQFPDELAHQGITKDMLLATQKFVLEQEEETGRTMIGLPEGTPVALPWSCKMQQFLSSIGSLLVVVLHTLSLYAWSCVSAYPLTSLIGLGIVLLVKARRDRLERRRKLIQETSHVRDSVYSILQGNAFVAHQVLHVRDQIGMELYPYSNTKRHGLFQTVWPRVVAQVAQDNRIAKSQVVNGSVIRDQWQWVAATTPQTKSVQIASTDQ